MKQISKILSLMLVVGVLSACSTQRFRLTNDSLGVLTDSEMQIFLIGGIAQTNKINAARRCGGLKNIQTVEFTQTFLDGIIGNLSSAIVTPRTANIYCKK